LPAQATNYLVGGFAGADYLVTDPGLTSLAAPASYGTAATSGTGAPVLPGSIPASPDTSAPAAMASGEFAASMVGLAASPAVVDAVWGMAFVGQAGLSASSTAGGAYPAATEPQTEFALGNVSGSSAVFKSETIVGSRAMFGKAAGGSAVPVTDSLILVNYAWQGVAAGPNAPVNTQIVVEACFAAGTPVLMADWTFKPIELIEENEFVLAVDDANPEGPLVARPVMRVYHNPPAPLLELTVAPAGSVASAASVRRSAVRAAGDVDIGAAVAVLEAPVSGDVIRVTANHRFYVRGRGWVEAGSLRFGDRFRGPNGEDVEFVANRDTGRVEPVFNMHVNGSLTYFVATCDRTACLLVHNWYGPPSGGSANHAAQGTTVHIKDAKGMHVVTVDSVLPTVQQGNFLVRGTETTPNGPRPITINVVYKQFRMMVPDRREAKLLGDVVSDALKKQKKEAKPVKLELKEAEEVLKAYIVAYKDVIDGQKGLPTTAQITENDRFLQVMSLLLNVVQTDQFFKDIKSVIFSLFTAFPGSKGYKTALDILQDLDKFAESNENREVAWDILVGRLKKKALEKLGKMEDKELEKLRIELDPLRKKGLENGQEKLAEALVERMKENLFGKQFGRTLPVNYPYRMEAFGGGGADGQTVKSTVTIIKYDDGTFRIILNAAYTLDPAANSRFKNFGNFHLVARQTIQYVDGLFNFVDKQAELIFEPLGQ
jgi:hypothetical protein